MVDKIKKMKKRWTKKSRNTNRSIYNEFKIHRSYKNRADKKDPFLMI